MPVGTDSERGTTIVEVTILVVAAVLILTGVLSGVVSHSAQRRVHSERILAMAACRNTLESLRSVPIGTLATLNGTSFDVPGVNGQPCGLTPRPGDADGLPGELSVKVDRSGTDSVVYLVQARVRWRGSARNGDFVMEVLMGERR